MKILQLLQKNLIWSIPTFMIAKILYGSFYNPAALKAGILPFTFLMVYPIMVNLGSQKKLKYQPCTAFHFILFVKIYSLIPINS